MEAILVEINRAPAQSFQTQQLQKLRTLKNHSRLFQSNRFIIFSFKLTIQRSDYQPVNTFCKRSITC